ncbi:LysR family transcriptional regulator [Labrenzia sp. OB1]|uniref:LysR family transcriptional regulator n=1 Tax=Labrenzia sp. OB1 TaxID=1561204 RepID=UPI0007B25FA0|nr:LysR family transcriptional regulator [Labrenzia sp. OB1]KZM50018.1 hypothetical protein OA90_11505 [Labrenzia sp. OB1]
MKRASLSGLRAFERTVATGSQGRAADDLGITQTAVSHAIRSLEKQLGRTLFNRSGGPSSLTGAGRDLASELAPAFERIDRAVVSAMGQSDVITVSVTPAFAACWLAPRLARSSGMGNTLPLRIHATTDLALPSDGAAISIRYAKDAQGERLRSERFQAVAGTSSETDDPADTRSTLVQTRWSQGHHFAPTWHCWFEELGESVPDTRKIIEFPDEHQVLQTALTGTGIALVSSILAGPLIQQGLLRVVRPDIWVDGLSYWMTVDPDRVSERTVRMICAWIRAGMRETEMGIAED